MRDGPPLKANVYCADTLAALSRDEGVLEMSDLKPMLLDAEAAAVAENLADAATPYLASKTIRPSRCTSNCTTSPTAPTT